MHDPSLAIPLPWVVASTRSTPRLAVVIHLHFVEFCNEFWNCMQGLPEPTDIYVSTTSQCHAEIIRSTFARWTRGIVEVRVFANRGRDIAAKVVGFADIYARYEYVLQLHGKRSTHASVLAPWRQFLTETLVGDGDGARSALAILEAEPRIGMIGVQHFEPMRHWVNWGGNADRCRLLASRMGFSLDTAAPLDFPSGSMFWARTAALRPLLDLGLTFDDFEPEDHQLDGTLAHAVERMFYFACEHAGFDWIKVARPDFHVDTPRIEKATTPAALHAWIERNRFALLSPGRERPRTQAPTPITAFEQLGGFDEQFFMYCEDVDLSWRARACGFSLKTCPTALFLHAVTNRPRDGAAAASTYRSALLLARKWAAPAAFDAWVLSEMKAQSIEVPDCLPALVPAEWRHLADFEHRTLFAPPRWISHD